MLSEYYEGSIVVALQSLYPEHSWQPWRFQEESVPLRFCDSMAAQKKFMDWLGSELGIVKMDDWYKVTKFDIASRGGGRLVNKYGGSPSKLLFEVFPDHDWAIWKFRNLPPGYWDSLENQRSFMDRLAKKLHIGKLEDWYKVTGDTIEKNGGARVLDRYGNSVSMLLQAVFPEHEWVFKARAAKKPRIEDQKFFDSKEIVAESPAQRKVPKGYWEDPNNLKEFMEWLGKELYIKKLEDWYRVSMNQIRQLAPTTAFKKYGIWKVLEQVYPSHSWDPKAKEGFGAAKAAQRMLAIRVRELFPNSEVREDYLDEDMRFKSGVKMELDVFLSKENLALEYQGEQHYYDIYALGPQWQYKERDIAKRKACLEKGITMIEIPYWWDGKKESLQATINSKRPELIAAPPTGEKPIPSTPPENPPKGRSWCLVSLARCSVLPDAWGNVGRREGSLRVVRFRQGAQRFLGG